MGQPHLSVYLQSSRLRHQHPPHFRYCNSQSFNTTIKMKSLQSLAVLGFAAAAQASYGYGWNTTSSEPVVYTTLTTDIYTTYCPEATTFTQGTKTYTATASETLTITDCPCTYSHPVTGTPKPTPSTYVAPPPPSTNATYTPVWVTTTEIVKTYTTYCPAPTTVVQGNHTYIVTEATTLTITDCPCTATNTYPGTTSTSPLAQPPPTARSQPPSSLAAPLTQLPPQALSPSPSALPPLSQSPPTQLPPLRFQPPPQRSQLLLPHTQLPPWRPVATPLEPSPQPHLDLPRSSPTVPVSNKLASVPWLLASSLWSSKDPFYTYYSTSLMI